MASKLLSQIITATQAREAPDWELLVRICDMTNVNPVVFSRPAVDFLTEQLKTTKDPKVLWLTLIVIDTMMKNCGEEFHSAMCNRETMRAMKQIIYKRWKKRKTGLTGEARMKNLAGEKAARMIQQWGISFHEKRSKFPLYYETYRRLISKGIRFPPATEETRTPIDTPAKRPDALRESLKASQKSPPPPGIAKLLKAAEDSVNLLFDLIGNTNSPKDLINDVCSELKKHLRDLQEQVNVNIDKEKILTQLLAMVDKVSDALRKAGVDIADDDSCSNNETSDDESRASFDDAEFAQTYVLNIKQGKDPFAEAQQARRSSYGSQSQAFTSPQKVQANGSNKNTPTATTTTTTTRRVSSPPQSNPFDLLSFDLPSNSGSTPQKAPSSSSLGAQQPSSPSFNWETFDTPLSPQSPQSSQSLATTSPSIQKPHQQTTQLSPTYNSAQVAATFGKYWTDAPTPVSSQQPMLQSSPQQQQQQQPNRHSMQLQPQQQQQQQQLQLQQQQVQNRHSVHIRPQNGNPFQPLQAQPQPNLFQPLQAQPQQISPFQPLPSQPHPYLQPNSFQAMSPQQTNAQFSQQPYMAQPQVVPVTNPFAQNTQGLAGPIVLTPEQQQAVFLQTQRAMQLNMQPPTYPYAQFQQPGAIQPSASQVNIQRMSSFSN